MWLKLFWNCSNDNGDNTKESMRCFNAYKMFWKLTSTIVSLAALHMGWLKFRAVFLARDKRLWINTDICWNVHAMFKKKGYVYFISFTCKAFLNLLF